MKRALRPLFVLALLALGACSSSCGAAPGPAPASAAAAPPGGAEPVAGTAPAAGSPRASAGGGQAASAGPGLARYVRPGVEGLIVAAEQAPRFLAVLAEPSGVTGPWSPSESDIDALEGGLAAWIGTAAGPTSGPRIVGRLPSTRRQYVGLERGGRRLVFVNAFCHVLGDDPEAWLREPVMVLDGGDCFFSFVYDVAARSYGELQVNGEA